MVYDRKIIQQDKKEQTLQVTKNLKIVGEVKRVRKTRIGKTNQMNRLMILEENERIMIIRIDGTKIKV